MSICTFFGHRDCGHNVKPLLYKAIEDLILNNTADNFYVGNNGEFDLCVLQVLRELKKKYGHISYWVVLPYIPCDRKQNDFDNEETIIPDGIENIYKRFAILYRNDWMVKKSDHVIVYVKRSYGGAAQFYQKALKLGKNTINIAD